MEQVWVEQWRDAMRVAAARLTGDFESRFGFPPGEHEVSGPAGATELAGLGEESPELVTFHRVVAEVKLPDVNNGYWIHRPPAPGEDRGLPHRLSDGRRIVVFGSDGGGGLFALAGAAVLRLAEGAEIDGAYDADRTEQVAGDLQQFLTALLAETETFAADPGR